MAYVHTIKAAVNLSDTLWKIHWGIHCAFNFFENFKWLYFKKFFEV